MRKIQFFFSNGERSVKKKIFVYDDDVTDEEIDSYLKDWVKGYVDAGWYEIEKQ